MGFFTQVIIDHARGHGGVVTRSEALALGVPKSTLNRMVAQGIVRRTGPGVYALPGMDDDHLVALHAACRKLGAVSSHQSAALIHGLDRLKYVKPTVSVSRRRTKEFLGVTVHQLTDLTDNHIVTIKGLPTTIPERTVMDLAAVLGDGHLERIVDNGLAAGSIQLTKLNSVFEQIGRQGKPGTVRMRAVLTTRESGYTAPESELERRLLKVLDSQGLPTPIRQYRPRWLSPTKGRVDVAYPDARLIIEGDSRRWHTMLNSFEIDRLRDNAAQLAGWRILRFTWEEITEHPERVVNDVTTGLKVSGYGPDMGRSS